MKFNGMLGCRFFNHPDICLLLYSSSIFLTLSFSMSFFLQCGLFCVAFIRYDCTAASGMTVVTNDFEIIWNQVTVV